jgi:hypothetical protein
MARDYGPWEPLTIAELTAELAGFARPWWVAGGYALEAFAGRSWRGHGDVDVGLFGEDAAAVRAHLAGWDAWAAWPAGTLVPWPAGEPLGLGCIAKGEWPWVELVTSHAGARPDGVRALVAAGVKGLVVAGTGNGSLHHALEAALIEAQAAGVTVWRTTRCLDGPVQATPADQLPSAGTLTPVQARIELMLQLMRT